MADTSVFISYRRKDKDFAQRLDGQFRKDGRRVWIDWEDIPPGSTDFTQDIARGIEGADAFVAILSPDYLDSPYCISELNYASQLKKRIVPIVWRKFEGQEVPGYISHINWVYFTPHIDQQNTFEEAYPVLVEALDTDLGHLQTHTQLLVRAKEWDTKEQNPGLLIGGAALKDAENWLAHASRKDPAPTDLHTAFIFASRNAQSQRQRRALIGVSVALAVSLALAVLSFILYGITVIREEETRSVALAAAGEGTIETNYIRSMALVTQGFDVNNTLLPVQRAFAEVAYAPGVQDVWTAHEDEVTALALNAAGDVAASGDWLGNIIIWDVATGNPLHQINAAEESIEDIVFSSDGTQILATADETSVRLWDVATGSLVREIEVDAFASAVDWVPDSTEAVVGLGNGLILIVDTETGEELDFFEEHDRWVAGVDVDPFGEYVASVDEDGVVLVWDYISLDVVQTLTDQSTFTQDVEFSPDGQSLLAGSLDDTLAVWDFLTPEQLRTLTGNVDQLMNVTHSADSTLVLGASVESTIFVWDIENGMLLRQLAGHTGSVNGIAISPDNQTILTASDDGRIIKWDLNSGALDATFTPFEEDLAARIDLNADASQLLTMGADSEVKIWDQSTGELVAEFDEHEGRAAEALFHPDGTTALSASEDGIIHRWQVDAGELIQTYSNVLNDPEFDILADFDISPDGTRLVAVTLAQRIVYMDADSGDVLYSSTGHDADILSVTFAPDGQSYVTTSDDWSLIWWDAETGEQIEQLWDHGGSVLDASFSPDGTYLLSVGVDQRLIVWLPDAENGTTIWLEYTGHRDWVSRAVFIEGESPQILTASYDGSLVLWDLDSGGIIRRLQDMPGLILDLAYDPATRRALSVANQEVMTWRIDTNDEMRAWAAQNRYIRPLSCDERDLYNVYPLCSDAEYDDESDL